MGGDHLHGLLTPFNCFFFSTLGHVSPRSDKKRLKVTVCAPIVFLVDDVPVRRYQKKVEATFPEREMWAYGSVWDASDWATDNGRYRADYRYQPFVSGFREFKVAGCEVGAPALCRPVAAGPGGGLSAQQGAAMRWAQQRSMVYYYCQDGSKDRSNYPEC
ncbi:xyloglucan endotransglucosylase/hydrolase protein 31-like [Lolium perenne]|uniref:xyloglucan endotransglucosylase/hydrolase protein 31-like n=1 Tax=Lolium perenne TaxID=4522 RepID=UPI0021F61ECD|nr:xyloglucan endotransglucosylase/hydrolase protein 31-like [Lolium perenne]